MIFYLKDFIGGIGVMLLKFRLLRSPDIFWNHASWSQKAWKRGNLKVYIVNIYICAWLSRCGSFGIASALQQFRATSTCCILSFSFIDGTSVLEFLSTILLGYSATHSCSEPKILFNVEPVGFTRFSPLRPLWRWKWARIFRPDIKKIWQERKPTCDETTRSRTVRVHIWNITPQFTLLVTTGGEF